MLLLHISLLWTVVISDKTLQTYTLFCSMRYCVGGTMLGIPIEVLLLAYYHLMNDMHYTHAFKYHCEGMRNVQTVKYKWCLYILKAQKAQRRIRHNLRISVWNDSSASLRSSSGHTKRATLLCVFCLLLPCRFQNRRSRRKPERISHLAVLKCEDFAKQIQKEDE